MFGSSRLITSESFSEAKLPPTGTRAIFTLPRASISDCAGYPVDVAQVSNRNIIVVKNKQGVARVGLFFRVSVGLHPGDEHTADLKLAGPGDGVRVRL